MAEETTPDSREWRGLYRAAVRVKELAPWEWMTEADTFCVQSPESGELGFVSVMGSLGEHYGVSFYLGSEGIHGFLDLQMMGPFADPDALLQIPQLHASFEDRGELDRRDREIIKKLGLKFRGRNAWPMFRAFRPSFFPWFLESGEARFLTVALEQLADVAPRFKEDASLLEPSEGEGYLLRVPRREGETLVWEDAATGVPPLDAPPIEVEMEASKMDALGRLPMRRARLEVDFFMIPASVQDRGDRPYFPHMLMVVDAKSGMIVGSELLTPFPPWRRCGVRFLRPSPIRSPKWSCGRRRSRSTRSCSSRSWSRWPKKRASGSSWRRPSRAWKWSGKTSSNPSVADTHGVARAHSGS
jgi:hypothetical protein